MKDVRPQPAEDALADGKSQVDIEAIIEQIWGDSGGTASRTDIRRVLLEVAPRYEGARITNFVPIFLRRDVLQRLRGGLTSTQGAGASKVEITASEGAAGSAVDDAAIAATEHASSKLLPT